MYWTLQIQSAKCYNEQYENGILIFAKDDI